MLIGELAEKTGLTRDTIRFYEKQRLISVGRKDRRENNYKEYSGDTLRRLLKIKTIKWFGFTLSETAEFLELLSNKQASCDNVAAKALEKVKLIEAKIQELNSIKNALIKNVNNCQTNSASSEDCPLFDSTYLTQ